MVNPLAALSVLSDLSSSEVPLRKIFLSILSLRGIPKQSRKLDRHAAGASRDDREILIKLMHIFELVLSKGMVYFS